MPRAILEPGRSNSKALKKIYKHLPGSSKLPPDLVLHVASSQNLGLLEGLLIGHVLYN